MSEPKRTVQQSMETGMKSAESPDPVRLQPQGEEAEDDSQKDYWGTFHRIAAADSGTFFLCL